MPLLTYSERKQVTQYKYDGKDNSYIYQYILSPMAQWCVDRWIPVWMAPNVVTTIGLIASFLSLGCVLKYNPTLGPNGPNWLHLLHAFTLFFYQTLDNMDGKQARKTNSSSALGMLFDHGCDAINCCVCIIPMASIFGIGWSMNIFVTMWCGFIAFYLQTWEQNYTGAMNLPLINGPSEGLVLAIWMCLTSYFCGSKWWLESLKPWLWVTSLFDFLKSYGFMMESLTYFEGLFNSRFGLLIIFSSTGVISTAIGHIHTVFGNVINTKKSLLNAIMELVPFFLFFYSVYIYCLHSKIALTLYPKTTILAISAVFVEIVTHLMLCHIVHRKIEWSKRYLAYGSVLLPFNIFLSNPMFEESTLLIYFTGFATCYTLACLYLMIVEIADILDIRIFSLTKLNGRGRFHQ